MVRSEQVRFFLWVFGEFVPRTRADDEARKGNGGRATKAISLAAGR